MAQPFKNLVLCICLSLLTACVERERPAPVEELRWKPFAKNSSQHIVARGETLYAVAFRYDLDYRCLAAFNHLPSPYTLRVGQRLNLRGAQFAKPKTVHWQNLHVASSPIKKPPLWSKISMPHFGQSWSWPVQGRIAANFFPAQGKKGIDIAGKKGDKIHAAADGVVAYAGGGLIGYGNLIIIKHSHEFLTAYGNNAKNLVKEGQHIKVGQTIAEMGVIDRRYWGLHFEMRKAGNPVNPLLYLRNN